MERDKYLIRVIRTFIVYLTETRLGKQTYNHGLEINALLEKF